MCVRNNPVHCILPPFILRSIAENGTPSQQAQARQNLITGGQMRNQREDYVPMAPDSPRLSSPDLQRLIYDAQNGSALPGVLVRSEGQPASNDVAVNESYDGAGATYDLFKAEYGRNSIDDQGMYLKSTVHYRVGYDNAFWNGQQMVYGDGDENLPVEDRLFNRFTIAIDIIGHELAHGVTQFSAGLVYQNQPGALNESMSDVFGSLVKQRVLGHSAFEADWIIGEGLFTPRVNGVGIRSMKEPGSAFDDPVLGKDPQPGHMDDYVNTSSDNGGVHINSGIPNRAFYISAVELGGFAWEKAGRIWYVTLRDKLNSGSNFADAARLTHQTAGELFGDGSLEQQAVKTGWAAVGITIDVDGDNGDDDDDDPQPGGCLPGILAAEFMRGFFAK